MNRFFLLVFFVVFYTTVYSQDKKLKFNHMYFVLDSTTYSNIKNNKNILSLASFDKGMPSFSPIDSSSTTIYLRGKSTYIEIMGPNNRFGEKIGSVGLGFSWDTKSLTNNNFTRKLVNTPKIPFKSFESKWNFEDTDVLWFTAYYSELNGTFSTWYSYYNPEFLSSLFQKKYSIFTRELFLQNAYKNSKTITDLCEIKLECSEDDFKKITTELKHFSIDKIKTSHNSKIFFIDNVKLVLIKSENNISQIKNIVFNANNRIEEKDFDFGKIKLENQEGKIIFNFY